MNAKADFIVNFAFVLTAEKIEKIYKLLTERIGKPAVSAGCADNIDRDFSDIKQLLDYENSHNRRITSLSFSSKTNDYKKRCQLSFANNSWRTISVTIEGIENSVVKLKDDVAELVDGTKAWYWRLSKFDFFYVILVLCIIGFNLLIDYAKSLDKNVIKSEFNPLKTLVAIGITSGVFIVLAGLVWSLNRIRKCLFPIAVFAIGQEATRYNIYDKIRWTIIIGFIVSLSASLVVAFI
jgi:hypothetical protein